MLRIKAEVCLYNYHSYAIVNYFLLKHLKNVEVFIELKNFLPNQEFKEEKLKLPMYHNQDYDIVFRSSFPYNCSADKHGKPVILFYTSEFDKPQLENFSHPISDFKKNKIHLLTCSQKSKNSFLGYLPSKKITVIPHGIDTSIFKREKIKQEKYTYLHISALSGNKNVEMIIDAYKQIKDSSTQLIIKCNSDIYKIPKYLDFTDVKLITDNYSFEQMNELYNSADCYVSAGYYEGFDIPILESQYFGLTTLCHKKAPMSKLVPVKNRFDSVDELAVLMNMAQCGMLNTTPFNDVIYSYESIAESFVNLCKSLQCQ